MDKHDLIKVLIDLSIEMGKTPTRAQFENNIRGGKHKLEKLFGGYTELVLAAGLEPRSSQRKITNEIFEKSLEKHLEDYVPRELVPQVPYPTMAIISDIHWPFESKKVLEKFYDYVSDNKPQYVIINGDAWDFYSHSKFSRSHNLFTPREEENLAREKNVEFWKKIKLLSPNSTCIQTLGNHDIRPMKRVLESYPEAEDWIRERMQKMFEFEGVKTIHDSREEVKIGNILIFHGYRTQLGAHRDFTLSNTINGHTHKGGVVFKHIHGQTLWELNSGLAGDPEAKGLTYTPQKITHWTPGFGIVNRYGPQFIHV